jgi:hypothetical protein
MTPITPPLKYGDRDAAVANLQGALLLLLENGLIATSLEEQSKLIEVLRPEQRQGDQPPAGRGRRLAGRHRGQECRRGQGPSADRGSNRRRRPLPGRVHARAAPGSRQEAGRSAGARVCRRNLPWCIGRALQRVEPRDLEFRVDGASGVCSAFGTENAHLRPLHALQRQPARPERVARTTGQHQQPLTLAKSPRSHR